MKSSGDDGASAMSIGALAARFGLATHVLPHGESAALVAPQVVAAPPEAQKFVGTWLDRAVLPVDDQQPEAGEGVAVDTAERSVVDDAHATGQQAAQLVVVTS
ncbi:hypothetical protein [Streptomyces lincolnensis]|uniref:hypothetical protein n=1 Tax=Streptomyces lincolnensis TaxID=1915 RepID=UPI000837385B|nr:hypothetical protein [Streptomyces lincolnensis]